MEFEKIKILIVDDNLTYQKTLKEQLIRHFPEAIVYCAQNGEESIDIAEKNQPDIVLLDILMPGIDGYEVCRRFKSSEALKTIPIVLVTIVNLDENSLTKALDAGADAFLPKPIDANNLQILILNMLKIRNAAKEIEEQARLLKEQFGDKIGILQKELEQRRKTESALIEKDLKSQILVDFAPQAIFQGNPDGSFVNANQKALEYTLFSKEEIVQMKMKDLFSEDEILKTPFNYEALEEGLVVNNERIVTRKDGSVFPVIMSTKKLPDGSYVSFFSDITEDKQNLQAILQKDNILQAIAEASQALLIEDDLQGGINAALAIIGNATSQDRVYIFEFHSLNDSDEIYMSQRFEWANKGISAQINNPELQNLRMADAAPRWYPILSSGEILYGNIADFPEVEKQALSAQDIISILVVPVLIDGKCRGFLGFDNCHCENNWSEAEVSMLNALASTIGLAIAKQRRKIELVEARKMIEEREAWLTTLLQASPDFICFKDGHGRWQISNDSGLELFMLKGVDYFGKTDAELAELTHPHFKTSFQNCAVSDEEAWIKGVTMKSDEYISKPDGSEYVFEVIKVPVFDENRQRKALVVLGRDITDRKSAEVELRKSEQNNKQMQELFRTIADNMPDMLWAKDLDKRFIFVNKAIAQNLLNAENTNEPIGKNDMYFALREREKYPENSNWHTFGEICRDSDAIVLESGENGQFDEFGNVQGKFLFLDVIKSPLKNESGEIIGTVGAGRDVTKRKKTERIKKMQSIISDAVNETQNLGELLAIVGQELDSLIAAKSFYVAFINEKDKTLYTPYISDIHDLAVWPMEGSATGMIINENRSVLLRKHEIMELVSQGKFMQLDILPKAWMGVPMRYEGKVTGAFVVQSYDNEDAYSESDLELLQFIATQISIYIRQKQAMDEIRLLGRAIEQSPAGIVITDADGLIEYVNPKFSDITGFETKELIGQNMKILQSGENDPAVYADMWSTIKKGVQWNGDILNRKKDGTPYWESVSISPILKEDGQIGHFVAVREDITEKKGMIAALVKSKEKAEESDRLKTAFLTNMSHEIRTPLNGILGFASLLTEGNKTNEEVKHHSNLILKSGKRLLELINNIIHISKIEAGAEEFLELPFSPAMLVQEANEQFLALAKNKKITLISSVPDDLRNLKTKSDLSKLHQVFANLISNAIKFTDKGTVETGFYLDEQFIRFFVKDSGKGIPEEHHKKIFERFYQVDNSYSRGHEGAGLGLSLCKSIIEKLGGEIFVESEIGKGSMFTFTLPLNEISVETGLTENTNSNSKEMNSHSGRILVADDDPASLSILQMMLQKQGYEVITCSNGLEAVELFHQNSEIVLLLLDIKMPGLDGFKTLEQIRAIAPDIPAIAVTAHALTGDAFRITKAGFDDYIAKPFTKRDVLSIIEQHFSV
ncbi:MAG: PAS domain S-box protein [Bacteroidetes bacterium]|nr:PAS domain S-box protein [Bacteroidota bacterium]